MGSAGGSLVYSDDLAQRPSATYVINGLDVTAERVFTYDARYPLVAARVASTTR